VIGCLTAPFRALGCLVVVGGLALGWLYRDQVVRTARGWLQRAEAPAAVSTSTGRPGVPRPDIRQVQGGLAQRLGRGFGRADPVGSRLPGG
jgi:hypothetical protein